MKNPIPAMTVALYAGLISSALAQPEWSAPVDPETARADLMALYEGLQSGHYDLYVNTPKDEYDAFFAATHAALREPLSRYELLLELQKFAAFGDVAHARIDYPGEVYAEFRQQGGKAFPIYPRIVAGRVYVGEDYSGADGVALGDEILSINGVPIDVVLAQMAAYLSADTPYIAHSLLEFTFPLYLWIVLGEQDTYSIQLRSEGERTRSVSLPALTQTALSEAIDLAPPVFALDFNERDARMLNDDIAYLRPGPFYNIEDPAQIWDETQFVAFIDGAFETFLAEDAQALIIDIRDNPGGDNSFSDPMVAWIADAPFRFASRFSVKSSAEAEASNQARLEANPDGEESVSALYAAAYRTTPYGEAFDFDIPMAMPREGARFEGEVFVLVNRRSYSNAVNVASIFQDYAWGDIVGELTADFATTYGAMEQFTLPATGFQVGFPKAHIIRPSGDERPGGVVPDVVIETPILPSAEDVVLNQLIEIINDR